MAEVVVGRCHGGWGPDEGWVQVPSGTTVYLFLDSFRAMHADDADRAVLSSPDDLRAMQGAASQVVNAFRTINNYGIQSLSDDDVVTEGPLQSGVELVNEEGLHLSDIFDKYKGSNIYWFACQALDGLNPKVEGVDLNDLRLDAVDQADLDMLEDLDLDDLDQDTLDDLEDADLDNIDPDAEGLSDEQVQQLRDLQSLASRVSLDDLKELKKLGAKMDLEKLKDLKKRKRLSNRIQRF